MRLVARLAHRGSAHAVLSISAVLGMLIMVGLAAAGAGVYDAVAEQDGISGLDQPVLNEAIGLRTAINTRLLTWVGRPACQSSPH